MALEPAITDIEQLKDRPELAALLSMNASAVTGAKFDRNELTIWVDLVTSNWSYWVGSTWMSGRCALTAATSGVYSSSTTGMPAMPPSTTMLPEPEGSSWRNCLTNGPPAVLMNVSVYSAAGDRAADAMTGAP